MNPEELSNEMAATRRAIAIYLKRLLVVEEKIDRFTREGTTLEGRASQTAGKDVAIGMSRLRTDVDIMPANELKSWIDNILSDVHIADVRTINDVLTRELKIDKLVRLAKRDFKACDRCYSTYPNNTNYCLYCPGNRKLRTFKVAMDLNAEIQKVMAVTPVMAIEEGDVRKQ